MCNWQGNRQGREQRFFWVSDLRKHKYRDLSDRGAVPKDPDKLRPAKKGQCASPRNPATSLSQLSIELAKMNKNASSVTKTEHEFPVPQATLVMPARNNELPRTIGAKSRKAGMKSARDKKV
jgi:hypothetical protein